MCRQRARWFIFVVCFLMATMTACSKIKGYEQPIVVDFECDANIQYKDMQMEGHITRVTTGMMKLEITSPDTIKGLVMEWDGAGISVTLNGVTFQVEPESLPVSGLGKSLLDVLDSAQNLQKIEGKVTDNGLVISGQGQNGTYQMISDPDNGHLKSISVPDLNLIVIIKNFVSA